jgi:polysaccharide deacetylase 2 family uncharacterized protein YibQ
LSKRRPPSRASKAAGGKRRRRGSIGRFLALFLAAVALFSLGVYFGERLLERGRALAERRAKSAHGAPSAGRPEAPRGATRVREPARPAVEPVSDQRPALPEGVPAARIAIVIDDLGREKGAVERLLAFGVPFTYAILPFEPKSVEIARFLESKGAEVMVHLPMEPKGKADPGPGALVHGMSRAELREATAAAIAAVPGATGVNNHMGSAMTTDPDAMRAVFAELAKDGLFFLDSRTSSDSVGYDQARERGIATARRDLFLDDTDDRAAIEGELAKLIDLARERGAAIGIAHPRPETFAAFEEVLPELRVQGVEVVPVSFLLERSEELPE